MKIKQMKKYLNTIALCMILVTSSLVFASCITKDVGRASREINVIWYSMYPEIEITVTGTPDEGMKRIGIINNSGSEIKIESGLNFS